MKIALCLKGYDKVDSCVVTRTTLEGIDLPLYETAFIDKFVQQYPEVERVRIEKVYVRDDWDSEDSK